MNVRQFPSNEHGRDFVVGDMHGQLSMFLRLLEISRFDPACDRVFSVGDLIDRGPDSPGCLALLAQPWFKAVRGNHEDMLIRTWMGRPTNWIANGGRWWSSVPLERRDPMAVACEALPLVIVVGEGSRRFNVLHGEWFGDDADLDAGEFCRDEIQSLLWGRLLIGGFPPDAKPGLSTTYVGHTPVDAVKRIGSLVYIDTGIGIFGGNLTMIEPLTGATFTTPREVAP